MASAAGAPWSDSGQASESPLAGPRTRVLKDVAVGPTDPTWDEIADGLWLAAVWNRWDSREPVTPDAKAEHLQERVSPRVTDWSARPEPETDTAGTSEVAGKGQQEFSPWPGPFDRGEAKQAMVLRGSGSLEVIRALRPLKRKVPDRREDHVLLDEDATAEQAIQDGLWLPVTIPESVRWLNLTLVVDAGPSMPLWESEVRSFIAQLGQLGAFRTIQLRLLDTSSPEGPILHGGTLKTPTRSPAELVDHSGHRVMLVVTDGLGESWRRGLVSPLLARWGTSMPVAVVHLLRQRLWKRVGMDVHRARLLVPGPLRPNRRWHTALVDSWIEPAEVPDRVVAVPVLEMNPRWLGWWARLVTGNHDGSVRGTVLLADPQPGDTSSSSAIPSEQPPTDQRVRDFVSAASPTARRLATHLAAAPVTHDVARVVQQELVPESGTEHLVELLIGGLVRFPSRNLGGQAWNETVFDFHDGVRQVLLQGARRRETAQVVRVVADHFGERIPALERLRDALDAPDSTPDPPYTEDPLYLALEEAVMRALGGPYLSRAARIREFEQDPQGPVSVTTETIKDTTMAQPERRSEPDPLRGAAQEDAGGSALLSMEGRGATGNAFGPPPPGLGDSLTEREREGRVPPVWGEVPPRNLLFTGRDELLDKLGQRLDAGGTTAVLPAALHGMGGIGKTQMAVEYIYRHLDDYDVVWWIQATQLSQVRKALTELAQQLGLPGSSEVHTAVPAVREALRLGKPYSRWLLVFDAAEDIDDIRGFFPTNGPGQILITSRNPDWVKVARPLEITVFARNESVALLRKRGPEISDEDANNLAEKLGDLPLAVEQAAAWRAETGMQVSEYLRLFDEKVAEILSTSAPTGYEMPVAAAWNVSFDELESRNPAAHQLLQVCAFFAPEPITRSLFTGGIRISISPDLDVALRDPIELGRAIRAINRYSLAKIDHRNNTLQLHRLVQLVLRNRMSEQTRADMRHGAHTLLANFDPNEPKSSKWWPRYQDIWPHIYSSESFECDEPWTRQLVINMMQFLYFWGDHEEAARLARKALERWTETLGETNSQVLEAASYLGLYLWALGKYTEAAELNLRTLELRRQVSGENSEETIIAQLRVAVDVRTRGEFATARELNEEIYKKAKGLYGEDDPITLQTAHDLAVSVRLSGDYRAAFELDKHNSERRGEVLGYDSVDTLNTLSGMYIDRRELGDYQRARDEHERIAQRVQELLGEEKADTLRRQAYLAVARRKAGDHQGAFELSQKAIELFRRRYGDDHPNAMACAVGYSIDQRHAGDLEGARELGEQTLERYRTNLGEDHPNTLGAAVNLAVTLRLRGDAAEARQLNERSLEQFRTTLGPDHPYAITCAIDLASDLAALGEVEDALTLGTEALQRARRVLGGDHPTTLAASLNVTLDLRTLGRTQEAATQYSETIDRYRRRLGEMHPGTLAAGKRIRANCDIDPLPS